MSLVITSTTIFVPSIKASACRYLIISVASSFDKSPITSKIFTFSGSISTTRPLIITCGATQIITLDLGKVLVIIFHSGSLARLVNKKKTYENTSCISNRNPRFNRLFLDINRWPES